MKRHQRKVIFIVLCFNPYGKTEIQTVRPAEIWILELRSESRKRGNGGY